MSSFINIDNKPFVIYFLVDFLSFLSVLPFFFFVFSFQMLINWRALQFTNNFAPSLGDYWFLIIWQIQKVSVLASGIKEKLLLSIKLKCHSLCLIMKRIWERQAHSGGLVFSLSTAIALRESLQSTREYELISMQFPSKLHVF